MDDVTTTGGAAATRSEGELTVPGAVLHLEVLGEGPVLALVGHPMGAGDLRGLAEQLAGTRTVLLHDPRGFGSSPLDDPGQDADPDVLADDLAALVRHLDRGPADVLGSSGGAVTALAFAARHPGLARTVVAHEPPLVSALPEAEEMRARCEEVVALLHEQGPGPAFGAFMALAGFGPPPRDDADDDPRPQQAHDGPPEHQEPSEQEMAAGYRMLAHGLVPICTYPLPVERLTGAGPRVVVAAGADSGTQLARRTAEAVAAALGTDLVDFPGDHAPFVVSMGGDPAPFAARLREVLGD